MDRSRLQHWLKSTHRTWRWSSADAETYDAVETTDEGLRWFRWSHAFRDDGVHGEHDVQLQSVEDFERNGPLREMPEQLEAELRHWLHEQR